MTFFVTMPKTAMDKNRRASGWKNQVWFAWQIFSMKPVAKAKAMYERADRFLDFRILTPHESHALATLLPSKSIHFCPSEIGADYARFGIFRQALT